MRDEIGDKGKRDIRFVSTGIRMTFNSQHSPLQPGVSFRELRIMSLLGAGGMGDAYLAIHPILKTLLVIKILKEIPEGDVFKEAHLAARIVSPNVVPILDAGIEQGRLFLVQQYVDGIDIHLVVDALGRLGRRLPVGVACGIIAGIASGLRAIHQAGVLHLDIKPLNVFIRGNGEAVLGDFGLALDRQSPMVRRYRKGTPLYKPPEQWTGSKLDRSSDLYSLGATAHFILTGQPPFPEEDTEALKNAHLYRPYHPPTELGPREAYAFSLVKSLLAKDPGERPARAEEVGIMFRHLATRSIMYSKTGPDAYRFGDLLVTLVLADLNEVEADVLIGSVTPGLSEESQDCDELWRFAGKEVKQELIKKGPLGLGQVFWSGAGRLKARKLAHAVAASDGAVCIQRCVLSFLLQAAIEGVRSVAFLPLGVGSGDVSMDQAAQCMLEAFLTVASWRFAEIQKILVILNSAEDLDLWRAHLEFFTPDSLENCLSDFESD